MRRVSLLVLVAAVAACGDDVAGRETISSREPAPAAAPTKQASASEVAVATLVRGRAIEEWIEDLRSEDDATKAAAEAALREAGDAAVPALLAWLFDEQYLFTEGDAVVRLLAERRDAAIPDVLARFESAASSKYPSKPMSLLEWIGESGGFGERAPLVVDAMLRRLDDDDSVRLLGHCGAAAERAVPEIARLLTSRPDSDAALAALAALGPRAIAALPDLVAYIRARGERRPVHADYRCGAIQAIGCIGPAAESAWPTLVEFARGDDYFRRSAALQALGDLGVVNEEVVEAIVAAVRRDAGASVEGATRTAELLDVRTPELYAALAAAIEAVPYGGEATAELLVSRAPGDVLAAEQVARLLGADDWHYYTLEALRGAPSALAAVSCLLVERTRSADPNVRVRSLRALARLDDPGARTAGLALVHSAVKDERLWAIAALAEGGAPDAATLSALSNAVKDADAGVAHEALVALGKFGPAAASVSKEVMALLDDPVHRDDAADALARMGVRDERVLACVAERLGSTDEAVRRHAAWVLADVGDAARSEIPRLTALLNASEERWGASGPAEALARLGAVAPLLAAVRDGAIAANEAAASFARVPEQHLDAVCGFSADPSAEVRTIVAGWLGDRSGARAQEQLVRLLADPAENVRVAAARAPDESVDLLPATVEALRRAANEDVPDVRIPAAVSLAPHDPAAAARALFELAEARNSGWADEALAQLSLLGPRASAVAPRLVEFLRAPFAWSKARFAMRALTSFPSEARAATPELAAIVSRRVRSGREEVIPSQDLADVRVQAAVLLGDFGGPGAAESLREALFDPSRDVREAAKAALAKVSAR